MRGNDENKEKRARATGRSNLPRSRMKIESASTTRTKDGIYPSDGHNGRQIQWKKSYGAKHHMHASEEKYLRMGRN